MSKNKHAGGRPPKKNETRIAKILELCKKGKTNVEIGQIIGVADTTIGRWKKKDLELCMAIRELKQEADELVQASLYKRATGMYYKEEQVTKDGVVNVKKYAPPDVKAAQFWLKNRDPKRWKDKVEIRADAVGKFLLDTGDEEESIDL